MKKILWQIPLLFSFLVFASLFVGAHQSYAASCSTGNDCPYYEYCDGGTWPFNNGTCRHFDLTGRTGNNPPICDNGSTAGWQFIAPSLGSWNGYTNWPWLDNGQGMACPEGIIFGKHTLGNSYCLHMGVCTDSEYSANASNYSGTFMCEVFDTNPQSSCGYFPSGDFNITCQGSQQCTNYQACAGTPNSGPCPGVMSSCACTCPVHTLCVDGARTTSGFYTLSGYNTPCTSMWCQPYCTTGGPVNCSAWNINQSNNTCGNASVSRTCQHDSNPNGACVITSASNYTDYGTTTYNYCTANYSCPNINNPPQNCVTNIFVHVYTDYNHDGVKNGTDAGQSGVYISDGGGNNFPTDANGNVTFSGKTTGSYTITETVPANFKAVNASSTTVNLTNGAGNQTVNFYLTPLYAISGRTFVDKNKDQKFNGSDTGYPTGTIHISGGPTAVADITVSPVDGTWTTPTNLQSGTYLVAYATGLPGGYQFTTPSSYSVTVGNPAGSPACNTGGSLDATCGGVNNGSIANLNIGVTNEITWRQSACFDVRNDGGTYSNLIPAAPSCGGISGAYDSVINGSCATGAGIIFSCSATPNFGLGSANANNWQAGGTAPNNECFVGAGLNVIRTSYNYLLTTARESNITPIDMATVCGGGGLANCTLPASLPRGVYQAQGTVNLNAYTFPIDPATPQGFIFLINGDMHIMGNIIVPAGSVAAFSTSGNIFVDPSVGNIITSPSDPAVNNPNIEGLYSADANFIVQSLTSATNICNLDGTPLDKKLNVIGSIITNAAQAGGSFQDNRDLCIYDTSCPAVSVGDNSGGTALSYLLTLFADGKFLTHKLYNWQELRP